MKEEMPSGRRRPSLLIGLLLGGALGIVPGFMLALRQSPPQVAERIGKDTCVICHDAYATEARIPHSMIECEDCHGPASLHFEAGGDESDPLNFKVREAEWTNAQCLACHEREPDLASFHRSVHSRNKISCADCHRLHPGQKEEKEPVRTALLRGKKNAVCIACHADVEADFRKPYSHPVLQGAVSCTDCHTPHADSGAAAPRVALATDEACVSCHAEKKGPFVFEHAPLEIDGCRSCHQPHGSIHAKMLVRAQVSQLCLECHSMTPGLPTAQPPAFHDIRSARFQNCTICHREIHGSNVDTDFLR